MYSKPNFIIVFDTTLRAIPTAKCSIAQPTSLNVAPQQENIKNIIVLMIVGRIIISVFLFKNTIQIIGYGYVLLKCSGSSVSLFYVVPTQILLFRKRDIDKNNCYTRAEARS